MERINSFLKNYWWLVLFIVLSTIAIFSRTFTNVMGALFLTTVIIALLFGILGFFWEFTFGRGGTNSWGIFRFLGIIGFLWFTIVLIIGPFDRGNIFWVDAINHPLFNLASLGLFFSLVLFILGEIFLTLHNLQTSIKDISERHLQSESVSNYMICPRCFGKGFVDLNDIIRLGMEEEWEQGYCDYCDGQGNVEKGITKYLNPLDDFDTDSSDEEIIE
jgi:hypothetical protein